MAEVRINLRDYFKEELPICNNLGLDNLDDIIVKTDIISEIYFENIFDKTAYEIEKSLNSKESDNILFSIDFENLKQGDRFSTWVGNFEVTVIFDGYIKLEEILFLEYEKELREKKEKEKEWEKNSIKMRENEIGQLYR